MSQARAAYCSLVLHIIGGAFGGTVVALLQYSTQDCTFCILGGDRGLYSVLCGALYSRVVKYSLCIVVKCSAVQCSAVQCSAVQCTQPFPGACLFVDYVSQKYFMI
jgi:hypothetical protein